jgi:hypothetical protein
MPAANEPRPVPAPEPALRALPWGSIGNAIGVVALAILLASSASLTSPPGILALDRYDPPNVEGQPLEVALKELSAWSDAWWPNQKPAIEVGDWPSAVDLNDVFVLHQTVNVFDDVAPPHIGLALGVQVPALVDLRFDVARKVAAARDLQLFPNDPNAGGNWIVVEQAPSPGDLVDFGSGVEVALRPSDLGPFDPPNVEGRPLEVAREELSAWGDAWWPNQPPFIDEGDWPHDVDIGDVFVLRQSVNGFDDVSPPNIGLALGVQIPTFVDLSFDVAREEAAVRHLELFPDDPDAGGDWSVIDQGPAPGELVDFGTGVKVAVEPPPAAPSPSLVPTPPPTPEPTASSSPVVASPSLVPTPPPTPVPTPEPRPSPVSTAGMLFGLVILLVVVLVAAVGAARWVRPRPPRPWVVRITAKGRPGPTPEARIEELEQ